MSDESGRENVGRQTIYTATVRPGNNGDVTIVFDHAPKVRYRSEVRRIDSLSVPADFVEQYKTAEGRYSFPAGKLRPYFAKRLAERVTEEQIQDWLGGGRREDEDEDNSDDIPQPKIVEMPNDRRSAVDDINPEKKK